MRDFHWSLAFIGITCFAAPREAVAWGEDGHRIVGEIAAGFITPGAREKVEALLGGQSMAEASLWADEVRRTDEHRATAPFHYVNIKPGAEGYEPERDCPQEGCVARAIENYAAVLRNAAADEAEQAEALKFLLHFVGDAHQPLHCAPSGDRGGNDVKVEFFGRRMNLHRVWDSAILERAGKEWAEHAIELSNRVTDEQYQRWSGHGLEQWIDESYKLSIAFAYDLPEDRRLGSEYFERCFRVVEVRLMHGGVRLAALLNRIFDPPP